MIRLDLAAECFSRLRFSSHHAGYIKRRSARLTRNKRRFSVVANSHTRTVVNVTQHYKRRRRRDHSKFVFTIDNNERRKKVKRSSETERATDKRARGEMVEGGGSRSVIVHAQSGLWEIDRRRYVCVVKREGEASLVFVFLVVERGRKSARRRVLLAYPAKLSTYISI